eukprot:Hpha_TRINITY_DN16252_c0_g5::TRINITY_DN16252_c0_g5_i1::g.14963::m.14963/K07359/CAMKK2; calcium/calmodulin-dependent protein kinase kinase 2
MDFEDGVIPMNLLLPPTVNNATKKLEAEAEVVTELDMPMKLQLPPTVNDTEKNAHEPAVVNDTKRVSFKCKGGEKATVVYESDQLKVSEDGDGELVGIVDNCGRAFEVLSKIGEGATSAVYKVRGPGDVLHAMKAVPSGPYAKAELSSLRRLNHPNVMQLESSAGCEGWDTVYIFTELLTGGELCSMTTEGTLQEDRWEEEEVRKKIMDLTAAVAHLHQNNVVHRDIKPQNCLLREPTGEVVLCDFGASARPKQGDDSTRRTAGTPFFSPPEACTGKRFSAKAQDVWSLGVTMYLLLYGRVPFGAGSRGIVELSLRLETEQLQLDVEGVEVSPECRDFLSRVLEKDLTRRMYIAEMVKHSWFRPRRGSLRSAVGPQTTPRPHPPSYDMGTPKRSEPRTPSASDFGSLDEMSTFSGETGVRSQMTFKRSATGSSMCAFRTRASARTPNWGVQELHAFPAESENVMRVMVIDDIFTARAHLVRRIASVTGSSDIKQSVDACADGHAAADHIIESGGSERYALVLVSLDLLSDAAPDVVGNLRRWEEEHDMRPMCIVGMARNPTEEQFRTALECGMTDVLPSPAPVRMLRRVLGCAGWTLRGPHTGEEAFDETSAFESHCKAREDNEPDVMSPRSRFSIRARLRQPRRSSFGVELVPDAAFASLPRVLTSPQPSPGLSPRPPAIRAPSKANTVVCDPSPPPDSPPAGIFRRHRSN